MKKFILAILILIPISFFAQKTVTGVITDETNFPLPGASVIIKGTSTGVVTDLDGKFSITLKETPATLSIIYLGFKTKEVVIVNQTQITVALEADSEQLDEIVIIGYGEVKKGDLTGSVTTVKPNKNAVDRAQNVEDLLQGRAAGVQVTANGNEPGAPSSIKIRGLNSLTGNTEPLYVIDGIIVDSATEDTLDPLSGGNSYLAPQAGISGVNPRDIESIEVLKDASATAIYGSRGANGVILITTKKGKSGETKFSYSNFSKVGVIANDIEVLKTSEYAKYGNEVRANLNFSPLFYIYNDNSVANFQNSEQFMIDNASTIERLEGVDWSEDTYQVAVTRNHRLTASGGGENSNYYFAIGHLDNQGLVPRSFAKKTDFAINLNNDLNSKLKLATKVTATYSENSASKGTDNLGGTNNNLVRQIISGAPILGFDDNNNAGTDFELALDGPRAWIEDYDDLSNETRILGSLKLDYEISDVFKYRVQVGADYRNKDRKIWYGTGLFRGQQVNGEAGFSNLNRFRYNIDNTLMFRKNFNRNHKINGTVGFVVDKSNITLKTNQASDFPNKDLRADGISFGQNFQAPFLGKQRETILSFLGRVNYTLFNKYLITATYRADGSSKFGEGKRWGHFPAVALAWKMEEESFIKNIESISQAKLRLGWGLTGNQGIPNYRTLTPFEPTQTPYSNASGGVASAIIPTNLANPDLTWETTSQYNAGLDVAFVNNRFSATVDVYYKTISDLLLNVEIGPSTGFENYFANQGELINKGIELSLSADIIDNESFKWNVYGNIAFNKNKVGELGIPPATFGNQTYSAFLGRQVSGGNFFKVPANIFIEGEAPALFYGFATDGIISDQTQLSTAPDFRGSPAQLGDVALVDQDGDGNITDTDLTIIGDPNPDFNYGFGSTLEYKDISLSFFFNGVYGNDIANGNLLRENYADQSTNNVRVEAYRDAWRPDNVNGAYPRVGYNIADETGFTDRLIEDGSFLRLSNVSLGYNIPVDNISFIDNAYISLSGQNLLLFTNYSGFDPEVNSFSFDPGRVGIDWNSFPNQKSVSMSLNLTF